MPRVTFALPPDETAPLLRKSRSTSALDVAHVTSSTRSILHPKFRPVKVIFFGGDDSKLPFYRQRRQRSGPLWKIILGIVGSITILLLFIVASTILLDEAHHPTGPYPAPPSSPSGDEVQRNPAYLIKAKNGAVASESDVCSGIGVDVLKEGGNAIDAAIATTFCIGVANLFSSGIGGGGFMTVRIPPTSPNKSSEVWTIDFRETAPALANKTMFVDDSKSARFGGLSVGVPGEVAGLAEAHGRWGSLPWSRLVQPSVDLAAGWKVGKELSRHLPSIEELIFRDPVWTAIFAPDGTILREGEIIRRTNYSRTLAAIASGGKDAFYKGEIADAITTAIQSTGGIMTHSDLEGYRVKAEPALVGSYRGRKVYVSRAPTSGPVLLHMLNLLERYDLPGEGRTGLNTHRLVEVMKFGFAAKTKVCDPDYTNDTSEIDEIATKAYGKFISANITDDRTHTPEYYNPIYDVPIDYGTSHTSVVDKNGMAVAITSTINFFFGSQVMDPLTGIMLNNEMADFSIPGIRNVIGLWPSPYNYPEPGKRPTSSTVPTIVENEDGSFFLVIGGSGGTKIFPSVVQVLLGITDWQLNPSEAIEWGRVHDQLYPLVVEVDDVLPKEELDGLRERGHNVTVLDVNRVAGIVQAAMKEGDTIYAASDSRKNGVAAGY